LNKSDKKYNNWLEKFKQEKKADEKRNILIFISVIFFLTITSFLIYSFWTGELKFIGKETTYVKAKIIEERRTHLGEGIYLQVGKCEFSFSQKRYITKFRTKELKRIYSRKEFQIGDSILLKISVENPNISKFIK
jgi:hypothetical protein